MRWAWASSPDCVFAEPEQEIADGYEEVAEAQEEINDIDEPSVYVLSRNENTGYAAFKQDSAIIENISVVFPVFFFLVAALVCVTTMTRMVDEQRTQIGVWKALGYSSAQISLKFVAYAGSAGILGCTLGFFLFSYFLPGVFWIAYSRMYNFSERLNYAFDPGMFLLTMAFSLLCTAGVSLYCCWHELNESPASILRPKAPKSGQRIMLERIGWLWKRLGFLLKVSLRNVMRYKQRFFLMILGVSGCTALLLTGFGVRDSIQNVTGYQYSDISLYDAELSFSEGMSREELEAFFKEQGEGIEKALLLSSSTVDVGCKGNIKSTKLSAVVEGEIEDFISLKAGSERFGYPESGKILLSRGIANKLDAKAGDMISLTNDDFAHIELECSAVFDNYIGNFVFITSEDMLRLEKELPINSAYLSFSKAPSLMAAELLGNEDVSYVALNQDMKNSIDDSLSSLNIIIVLIIILAGALAFIVLFNLININIGERIREIATIKVLGFYTNESSAYVFREVNMLTALGTLLGLWLGKLLHAFVMAQIQPDGICFDVRIAWQSYVFSTILSFVFAALVRLVMRGKLRKISMTESLKSVE